MLESALSEGQRGIFKIMLRELRWNGYSKLPIDGDYGSALLPHVRKEFADTVFLELGSFQWLVRRSHIPVLQHLLLLEEASSDDEKHL